MSKARQRARAEREADRARAQAKATRTPDRQTRPAAPKPKPERRPVYRQRRFPKLPWRLKLALGLGWLAVAAAVLLLAPTWTGRLGLLVVATMALPLIVVLVRDPTRRTR